MNQNELKKELQMNLPEPPEGFDARSEATLAKLMIEEEPLVKKKISVGLVFALVFALLSLTALAAGLSGWNIGDFSRFYMDQDVPENFESGFYFTFKHVLANNMKDETVGVFCPEYISES